jgi:hypothetical protein
MGIYRDHDDKIICLRAWRLVLYVSARPAYGGRGLCWIPFSIHPRHGRGMLRRLI